MIDEGYLFSLSQGMDIVLTYLESGSINGLNHIAATKKWEKLFWILVVNGGFVISGYESFSSSCHFIVTMWNLFVNFL